jgi:HTH-type transcriptional regulator/antitoxin HigA
MTGSMQTKSRYESNLIGSEKCCVRPIRNEDHYRGALAEIDRLIDFPEGSPEAEALEVLSILVADYEDRHHAIEAPDPITFLEFVMESRGLTRKDLEPYIGSRSRVAEIMNRRRKLSMEMVRRLCKGLNLPGDVLIQPYSIGAVREAA